MNPTKESFVRVYNPGAEGTPPLVRASTVPGGPAVPCVAVPPLFCPIDQRTKERIPQFLEHRPGAAYIPLPDHGYGQILKGTWFDIPAGVPLKAVIDAGPKRTTQGAGGDKDVPLLMTEAEYEDAQAATAEVEPKAVPETNKTAPAAQKTAAAKG